MLGVWGSRKGGKGAAFTYSEEHYVLSEAEFLDVLGAKVLRDIGWSPSGVTVTTCWWRAIFLERGVATGWWNVFIRSLWYNHLFFELIFRFLMNITCFFLSFPQEIIELLETLGAKFIIAIKTFSCVKTLVKFSFKITFSASISLLSYTVIKGYRFSRPIFYSVDHCFKYIYWHIPDQRQIVFFVILFPMFCIFALFTSYFLCLPRGSMWWWTAVEIYIFLALTPEEGLTPSPYGVLPRVHSLIMHGTALSLMHSPFCTEQFCSVWTLFSIQSTQYGTGRVDSLLLKGPKHEIFVAFFYTVQACMGRWLRTTLYTKNLYLVRPICFFCLWAVYMSIWCLQFVPARS